MISRSGLSNVFIVMLGALFALLMIAVAADWLFDLGTRITGSAPGGIIWPATAVLGLVVLPGLVQGLFVGYLCREREAHHATLSACIAVALLAVFVAATLKRVQFGAEIPSVNLRMAIAGLGVLFCALFVPAARLGGHLAYLERASRDTRGRTDETNRDADK